MTRIVLDRATLAFFRFMRRTMSVLFAKTLPYRIPGGLTKLAADFRLALVLSITVRTCRQLFYSFGSINIAERQDKQTAWLET